MQGNLEGLIVAQMRGHSSAGILQTYAKLIDEYRRDAVRKLEAFRRASEHFEEEIVSNGPRQLLERTQ